MYIIYLTILGHIIGVIRLTKWKIGYLFGGVTKPSCILRLSSKK